MPLRPALVLLLTLLLGAHPSPAGALADWEASLLAARRAADAFDLEGAEAGFVEAQAKAEASDEAAFAVPTVRFHHGEFYFQVPYAPGADRAGELLEASAQGIEEYGGATTPALAVVLLRLSQVQLEAGREEEADASFDRSRAIAATFLPEPALAQWTPGTEVLDPGQFFAATRAAGTSGPAPSGSPEACAPGPVLSGPVDPDDTYLRPSMEAEDGTLRYVHVTESDMPWVVAVPRPKRPPKLGSTKDARRVTVEAMQQWEAAIQKHLPWFQLEFVEEDEAAPVQVVWKRRIPGPWAGFGRQRWDVREGCLAVGGKMEVAIRSKEGVWSHLNLEQLRELVAHEFGHVLGLGHCHACESIMNYEHDERTEITDLDVRTFLKLISVPNGATVPAGSPPGQAGGAGD